MNNRHDLNPPDNTLDRLVLSSRTRLLNGILAGVGQATLFILTAIAAAAVLFIIFFIARDAIPFFRLRGFHEFFTSTHWYPSGDPPAFGALAIIHGSMLVTLGAAVVAVPLGISAAICLSDVLPFSARQTIKPVIEILAAIPSVAYGFLALVVLAPMLQRDGGQLLAIAWYALAIPFSLIAIAVISDLITARIESDARRNIARLLAMLACGTAVTWLTIHVGKALYGFTIITGTNALNVSIILGVMALPTVVSVSEDALQAVGRELREGSYALGATRAETLVKIIMPAASSGILAAVLLGIMRALGETMVVWMASGNAAQIPAPWYNYFAPVRTLTATIAGDMGEADHVTGSARFHVLFAMGLLLLIFCFVTNLIAEWVVARQRRRLTGRSSMRLGTRKLLDHSFSAMGMISILIMGITLIVILAPIFKRGAEAFVFKATIEHRRLLKERFERGDAHSLKVEMDEVQKARQPIYDMLTRFESKQSHKLDALLPLLNTLAERDDSVGRLVKRRLRRLGDDSSFLEREKTIQKISNHLKNSVVEQEIDSVISRIDHTLESVTEHTEGLAELQSRLEALLGPAPGTPAPALPRMQYGATRWNRAQAKLHDLLYVEQWNYSGDSMGRKVFIPRVDSFRGTELEPLFDYVETHVEDILHPRWTFYWGFLTDEPLDIHIFGGIFPELIGTIYLTIGAILFAVPLGIIAAIYFTEYARPGRIVGFLRTCISTLAGVPSIVFGMFGLAFFLNVCHLPKSVLAGALTLSLVILPTIIRASEEAIRTVPNTYREAALSLGAGRWHTIVTVILPAALPGILTGTVISMGRAAGETAPIIFTAAASVAATLSLNPLAAWNQPTPALSWNIYNLCTEHEAVNEIRHVQFGMVAVLVTLVLILNALAIVLRARIARKLKG